MNKLVPIAVAGAMVLVVCSSLAAVAATDAPFSDGSVEKARVTFQQGVELFHEGSFDAALVEFRKAYRLAPSFRILFNIGQTYFELHDFVNALRTFQQYLAEGKAEIPSSRRAEVEAMLEKLEGRVARLEVQTNVDGAEILVDDVSAGLSPLPFPIMVNAGRRRVTVTREGYAISTRQVDLSLGEEAAMVIHLDRVRPSAAEVGVAARPSPLTMSPPVTARSSNALVISVVATATCTVGATVFGLLALGAKRDFERQLGTYPTSEDRIDSARATMLTYAVVTDVFAVAALAGAGLTAYYLWLSPSAHVSHARSAKRSVALQPMLGGLMLDGHW